VGRGDGLRPPRPKAERGLVPHHAARTNLALCLSWLARFYVGVGRKERTCQWVLYLMQMGLLRGPAVELRNVRVKSYGRGCLIASESAQNGPCVI
jgi:hypothetical protein